MNDIKILYTGFHRSGRTSSLEHIARRAAPGFHFWEEDTRGWRFSWKAGESTYPLHVGKTIYRTRFSHIWDIPELLNHPEGCHEADFLRSADGIVFVADSVSHMFDLAVMLLKRTAGELRFMGSRPEIIPVVFQLNKRDLPDALPIEAMKRELTWPICDHIETNAETGVGVVESLDRLIKLIEQVKGRDLSVGKAE